MTPNDSDPTEKTYRDIGEFMVTFSHVEACLRFALGLALDLTEEQIPVITSGFDFAHLVRVTKQLYQSRIPDSEEGRNAITYIASECNALNDTRNHVAHGLWTVDPSGVQSSHISRQSLKENVKFTAPDELPAQTEKAKALVTLFTVLFLVEAGREFFKRPDVRKAWEDFKKFLTPASD